MLVEVQRATLVSLGTLVHKMWGLVMTPQRWWGAGRGSAMKPGHLLSDQVPAGATAATARPAAGGGSATEAGGRAEVGGVWRASCAVAFPRCAHLGTCSGLVGLCCDLLESQERALLILKKPGS